MPSKSVSIKISFFWASATILRQAAELVGSLVTLAVGIAIAFRIGRASPTGALLLVPVMVWVGLATVYLVARARQPLQ